MEVPNLGLALISGVNNQGERLLGSSVSVLFSADDASFAEAVLANMAEQGILGGFNLSEFGADLNNCILVCATETKTDEDIDAYIAAMRDVLESSSKKSA